MTIHKLLPLLALGLNLLLLGSALTADRRSHKNIVFAYLATALAVWNLGVFGLRATQDPAVAMAWERVLHFGVIPIPVLFHHYVLVFLDIPRRRPSLVAGYVLCGVFLAASPTPAFLTGVTDTAWGFAPATGPLYAPFVVYFQAYLLLGLVRLLRAYRSLSSSVRRNRTLLVILGTVVSLLGGAIDFVRFVVGWEGLYPIGIPSNAVFALALGVAIVRYRLMDVAGFAKRLVLYLLTSAALAPVLFLGLYVLDQLIIGRPPAGPEPGGELGVLLRDALILLLVFTIALPLLRRLEAGLERLMFRRRHGVRDALVALSKELASLLDVARLARTLTGGLVSRIPAMHASLHLSDPGTGRFVLVADAAADAGEVSAARAPLDPDLALWLRMTARTFVVEETSLQPRPAPRLRGEVSRLERGRVALLVPLFLETELAAVLVLGEKLSGEIFDTDEIELLEMLMGQTAIALKNARLYEDLRARMDEVQRTQEQLLRSARLAAIGELAASVAHEVNNPLTVILGNGGLLLRQLPPESPQLGRVTNIVNEATRAGTIVRNLLDFARRREPKREPLALHEVLDRALSLLQSRLDHGHVEVRRVYDDSLPIVPGDRDQLTQVFVNLAANAVDAMEGGGTLVVQTEARQEEGRPMVVVAVSDTGPGIPPETLARIFEPFYTTKADGHGTGLGLSISEGIVRSHGGRIEVESAPGHGTTMRVRLPG